MHLPLLLCVLLGRRQIDATKRGTMICRCHHQKMCLPKEDTPLADEEGACPSGKEGTPLACEEGARLSNEGKEALPMERMPALATRRMFPLPTGGNCAAQSTKQSTLSFSPPLSVIVNQHQRVDNNWWCWNAHTATGIAVHYQEHCQCSRH